MRRMGYIKKLLEFGEEVPVAGGQTSRLRSDYDVEARPSGEGNAFGCRAKSPLNGISIGRSFCHLGANSKPETVRLLAAWRHAHVEVAGPSCSALAKDATKVFILAQALGRRQHG